MIRNSITIKKKNDDLCLCIILHTKQSPLFGRSIYFAIETYNSNTILKELPTISEHLSYIIENDVNHLTLTNIVFKVKMTVNYYYFHITFLRRV
jgi:hypothetical protein